MSNGTPPIMADELESAEALAYQAREVGLLLEKDVVKAAWTATERRITKEWESGQSPLEREMAWHKLQAFKTLQTEIRVLAQRPR
jgi:hypothetical protein